MGPRIEDETKVMVKRRRELGRPCVRVPWLEGWLRYWYI